MKNYPTSSQRRRVMIFGTFDVLHPGHEYLLQEAGKRGEVIVIVARDTNVERIKGRLPKQNEAARSLAIRRKFPSYEVRLGDSKDFLIPVREVQPDLVILGYDQILPPGVSNEKLGCPVERLEGFRPERFKSSLMG